MNSNSVNIRRTIGLVGLAVGLSAMPAAGQATYQWFGLGDGVSFSDPLNWSPSGLPGSLDEAKFDGAGSQTISFASSPVNAITSVENDTVLFNLTGQTYTSSALIVGDRLTDVGMLTINGGHLVTDTNPAKIGRRSPANGTLILTNSATMTNLRDLLVGDEGVGHFQIDAGCAATSFITFLANADTATGDAVIRGQWTIQNSALIGNGGVGSLSVEAGGIVNVGFETKVGDDEFSSGSLTIDGTGSALTSTAATTVGNFGTGSLTVSNGGQLTTAQLKIADDAVADVLVDAGTIIDTIGTGIGNRATGTLTLANGGMVHSPLVTVVSLGTLSGSGTINGPVLNDGVVEPGNGTGTLNVTGAYNQPLGILNIEIGGPTAGTEYDQLLVGGASTLGGTLNVSLVNGYNPSNGSFVILQGGTVSGAFVVENLPAGFSISYEADRVMVSIGSSCAADLNGDGGLDFFDVLQYLDAFSNGDPQADLTGDGAIDFFDVLQYLNLFSAGC